MLWIRNRSLKDYIRSRKDRNMLLSESQDGCHRLKANCGTPFLHNFSGIAAFEPGFSLLISFTKFVLRKAKERCEPVISPLHLSPPPPFGLNLHLLYVRFSSKLMVAVASMLLKLLKKFSLKQRN